VLTDEKISVIMPGGVKVQVDNPLAYYPFKTIPDGFEDEVLDVRISESL
jgi:tyrosinase